MTNEEKQLLLEDLSARLPYGVKIFHEITNESGNTHTYDGYIFYELSNDGQHITLLNYDDKHGVCEVDVEFGTFKPYLRSLSSMTNEEFDKLKEYSELKYDQLDLTSFQNGTYKCLDFYLNEVPNDVVIRVFDWLNKYHFDYRNLIQRDLAIEVSEENNPYEFKSRR